MQLTSLNRSGVNVTINIAPKIIEWIWGEVMSTLDSIETFKFSSI